MGNRAQFAIFLSLAVAVVMLVGKLGAYFITQSTAILSDASESVIHIVATGIAAFSFSLAQKPADEAHPYGHGRVVAYSVGLEGLLIFAAAIFILVEAVHAIVTGPELRELGIGLLITGVLAIINLALGRYLVSVGQRSGEAVLVANGQHVLTDMWTSAAVVGGVAVVWLTGVVWLDPAIAILAAIHIIFTGLGLVRDAVNFSMDQVDPNDTARIRTTLTSLVSSGLIVGYHQLRHRKVNSRRWIEVHLLVPGELRVSEAHTRATQVEDELEKIFSEEEVHVTTHIEPEDHDAAHPEGHPEDPLTG